MEVSVVELLRCSNSAILRSWRMFIYNKVWNTKEEDNPEIDRLQEIERNTRCPLSYNHHHMLFHHNIWYVIGTPLLALLYFVSFIESPSFSKAEHLTYCSTQSIPSIFHNFVLIVVVVAVDPILRLTDITECNGYLQIYLFRKFS